MAKRAALPVPLRTADCSSSSIGPRDGQGVSASAADLTVASTPVSRGLIRPVAVTGRLPRATAA